MINGKQAWLIMGTGIAAYEYLCDDGELLSEVADRAMLSHPWLTRAVVMAVAGHLINAFDRNPRLDLVSLGFVGLRKARRWHQGNNN